MNKVTVKIVNTEYPIVGEESQEYLMSLGEYVNNEVEDILKTSHNIGLLVATTLAAINIADKLFKNTIEVNDEDENNILSMLEFKIKEKDMQIESLSEKLEEVMYNNEHDALRDQLKEMTEISNEFQNKVYELQQEVELLKQKLKER